MSSPEAVRQTKQEGQFCGLMSLETIRTAKRDCGQVEWEEIQTDSFAQAHFELGKLVKDEVAEISAKKMASFSNKKTLIADIERTKLCGQAMIDKFGDPNVSLEVKDLISDYFTCLTAWARGTELEGYLNGVSALDLALWLQNDYSGCQTRMIKVGKSVMVLHTEEDEDQNVKKTQLVTFGRGRETITFLAYPHLLPGASFGWDNRGYFQACDYLVNLGTKGNPGVLANAAAWMCLCAGKRTKPEKILNELLPFIDGYALNYVQAGCGDVEAKTIEFAHDKVAPPILLNERLYHNTQAETPEIRACQLTEADKFNVEKQNELVKRAAMEERFKVLTSGDFHWPFTLEKIMGILAFRQGGKSATASARTIAYVGAKINSDKTMEIYVGAGPATKKDLQPENLTRTPVFEQGGVRVHLISNTALH